MTIKSVIHPTTKVPCAAHASPFRFVAGRVVANSRAIAECFDLDHAGIMAAVAVLLGSNPALASAEFVACYDLVEVEQAGRLQFIPDSDAASYEMSAHGFRLLSFGLADEDEREDLLAVYDAVDDAEREHAFPTFGDIDERVLQAALSRQAPPSAA